MTLELGAWHYELEKGMQGTEVAALQINLGLVEDGVFGKQTENKVKAWQTDHNLTSDGVVGAKTFQSIVVELSTPAARKYNLPVGLAKSISFAESNFIVGASGPHPSDAGWDIGAYMISSGESFPSQDFIRESFDVKKASEKACGWLREARDRVTDVVESQYVYDLANANIGMFKWQMAVLSHNWPYAAQNIPRRGHIFNDPAQDDKPAAWIEQVTNYRLHTPREWVVNYVRKSTKFVDLENA